MSVDIRGTTGITAPGFSGDGAGLSGVVTPDSNQICKAWVNFNAQGTIFIRATHNVSSITDHGAGRFAVNFINAMSDTHYSLSGGGKWVPYNGDYNHPQIGFDREHNPLTTSVRIVTSWGNTTDDPEIASLQIFGN